MANQKAVYKAVMFGNVNNISFREFVKCLEVMGFTIREGKGSHLIAEYGGLDEILILQPAKDGKVKPYQARQARKADTEIQDQRQYEVTSSL